MERVVTSAEMRACDLRAIRTLKIPGLVLMENAGRGVAETVRRRFAPLAGKHALILCGKGNNGGDGFVAARHLAQHAMSVDAVLVGKPAELRGDALANYRALVNLARASRGSVRVACVSSARALSRFRSCDVAIDALTGTGFRGAMKEPYASVIRFFNALKAPKVSVDIPSGVDADTGSVANVAAAADVTVTMALKKIGLLLGAGKGRAGEVEVADISMPASVVRPQKSPGVWCVTGRDVILPRRPFDAHKHSVGKIFVLAGSPGLTGAAAMVATAAMRTGAGAVVLGTPESVYPVLARKLTEVMVVPLPSGSSGSISPGALERIREHIEWCDQMVMGPGLSRAEETQELIWEIVRTARKPMLIDADGLNALALNPGVLQRRRGRHVIITPHAGEFARLLKLSAAEVDADRLALARAFARKFKLTVVSKGAPSLTAFASGDVYLNTTGNPGLATAGAGDVLSGIIAGLWGQGMSDAEAAYCGIYLHGLAGDLAALEFGQRAMVATDLITQLPRAIRTVEGGA